ncbi:MAG: alpha/beta fold hydrolase [Natronomonas sp.]
MRNSCPAISSDYSITSRYPLADLMGYSMGARISMHALLETPERIQACVLGGVGGRTLCVDGYSTDIADALSTSDPSEVADPTAREFREFAERRGNDLDSLAACRRAPPAGLGLDEGTLSTIATPVLVAAGSNDELVGAPGPLADAIYGARSVVVPDCDHLETVDSADFEEAVVAFLDVHGLS